VRTKTNTKTFEEEEELIFCKKEFRERAKIFSRKRKKTGKSRRKSRQPH
jgi:hypothetical protein